MRFLAATGCVKCICVGVHGMSDLLEEQDVLFALFGAVGIFPVDVYAVKPMVFDQLDAAICEGFAALGCRCWAVQMFGDLGVGPAADGEKDFQVTVALFEQVELLQAAIEVFSGVVPGVPSVGPMDVHVGPWVCEEAV